MFPPLHSFRLQLVAAILRFSNLDLYPHSHASVFSFINMATPTPFIKQCVCFQNYWFSYKEEEGSRKSEHYLPLLVNLAVISFCFLLFFC